MVYRMRLLKVVEKRNEFSEPIYDDDGNGDDDRNELWKVENLSCLSPPLLLNVTRDRSN